MQKVVMLLRDHRVDSMEVDDILEFISLYPEWLSNNDPLWDKITRVRDYLFCKKEIDDNCLRDILSAFLYDLIQVSLSTFIVFEPFDLTKDGISVYNKYKDMPINLDDFKGVNYRFFKHVQGKELTGVKFLMNLLKEVNSL